MIIIKNISVGLREGLLKFRKRLEKSISQRRGRPRILLRILSLVVCICLLCTFTMKIHRKAEPIALSALENTVSAFIEQTVIYAVKCSLEEKKYTWDDFCTKVVAPDGSIAALNANTANMSMMCADVVARINSEIKHKKYINIPVPIGSIVAPKYLSGKGFRINVRAVPYVSVSAEISSEICEAGINQTLHKVSMTVVSDVQVICMSESVAFRRESCVVLAESLIVGKIPLGS
ncbi:MAG: sporulation protein YunB [Clostridia bacterium]|nr:sporulation protein YunB [Clostridia bacterium]